MGAGLLQSLPRPVIQLNHPKLTSTGRGTINDIAGNGTAGFSGDSSSATSAELNSPSGLATDSSGNLYIADSGNNRVRKVDTSGNIHTIAGNGTAGFSGDGGSATSAELNGPVGLAVDGSGDVFIADTGNNRIRKVDSSGNITTYAGTGTAGYSGDGGAATSAKINGAASLALDGAGNLYLTDTGNNRIRKVDTSGDVSTVAGDGTAGYSGDGGPAVDAELDTPDSIAVDIVGDIFVLDGPSNKIVRKVDEGTGVITSVDAGDVCVIALDRRRPARRIRGDVSLPACVVAVDSAENLFISNFGQIREHAPGQQGSTSLAAGGGSTDCSGDGGPAVGAGLGNISGMAIDSAGDLDVSSTTCSNVRQAAQAAAPGISAPTTPFTQAEVSGPGTTLAPNTCKACSGQRPIDTSTGAQWEQRSDLAIPSRGIPLNLSESYSTVTASQSGPLGFGWAWSYGIKLTNGDGTALSSSPASVAFDDETTSQTVFSLSGSTWSGPARDVASLTHNTDGSWTFVRRSVQSLTFDSSGRLTAETDLNRETTTITYPSSTSITVTDSAGRTLTATLDTTATPPRITQVADSSSPARTVQFQYDTSDNLTHIIDVNGGDTAYAYDSSHRLVTMRLPRYASDGPMPSPVSGCSATPPTHVVSTHYDSTGRVDCQFDQLGRKTTYAYTSDTGAWLVKSALVTDPAANEVQYNYANGELVSIVRGYGTTDAAIWNYRYDPTTVGGTWAEDPNGNVTTATYDSHGNRTSATDALFRTTTWTYSSYNEIASVTPPATYGGSTVTTSYSYDETGYSSGGVGNLTTVSTPLKKADGTSLGTRTVHYQYATTAHPGDVTSMIDANGNTWTYTHDSTTGYVTETTSPSVTDQGSGSVQDSTISCYNTTTGFVTKTISARGVAAGETCTTSTPSYTTTYAHDPDGKLTTTTDPLGHTTSATFDADRNQASAMDANGNVTTYTYDAADELTTTTRPDSTTMKNDWNADGTLEDQVDGNNKTTSYGYDHLGRQTSVTDPLTRTTSYVLDGIGNVLAKVDPTGSCTGTISKCTTYAYDAGNELTAIDYSDYSDQNVSIPAYPTGYDGNGRRLQMTDATGTSSWVWDSAGEMLAYTSGAGSTVAYGYDSKGQETAITYPGQTTPVSRAFDAAGRLSSVEDWNSKTATFSYDADSDLTAQVVPSTSLFTDTYSFDTADRLYSIADGTSTTPQAGFTYQRDPAGQVLSVAGFGTGRGEAARTYSYNSLEQLTANARASVLSASTENTAVVRPDGSVWTWGDNTDGQLGNGSGTPATTSAPAQVSSGSMTNITAVAGGQTIQYTAALDASGSVWAWGNNSVGDLGNGSTTNSNVPVKVASNASGHPALAGAIAVAAGGQHTLALLSNGSVWAWGDNAHGQLGIGSTTPTHENYAVQVNGVGGSGSLSGVVSIAATKNGSAAILSNGTVVAWGTNANDQLGYAGADASNPVVVSGITGTPIAVAGGTDQMMVLTSDGHVWTWGGNANGQQGQGTTSGTPSPTPTKVKDVSGGSTVLSNVTAIAAGGGFDMALTSDGTLDEWGSGGNGQLGVGTTATHSLPVVVKGVGGTGSLSTIVGIAGGLQHAVAVDSGGNLYAWGINTQGELGDNTITQRTTPVVVYQGSPAVGTLSAATPYHYDTADNLTTQPSGIAQSFDAANEICASIPSGTTWSTPCSGTAPTGVTTYSYDTKGNRTTSTIGSSTTTYAYDQTNRLCAYIPAGTTWSTPCSGIAPSGVSTYTYDGDGLRQSKTIPSGTTNFTWDESGPAPLLIVEGSTYDIDGPGGLPLEQISGSTTLYYHHDQLGSTRLITDATGGVAGIGTDRYSYDAYGNITTTGSPTTTPTLGYAGQYTDSESGLVYLRARYYAPASGLFMTRDPATPLTRSPYGYVEGNPQNHRDPGGLDSSCQDGWIPVTDSQGVPLPDECTPSGPSDPGSANQGTGPNQQAPTPGTWNPGNPTSFDPFYFCPLQASVPFIGQVKFVALVGSIISIFAGGPGISVGAATVDAGTVLAATGTATSVASAALGPADAGCRATRVGVAIGAAILGGAIGQSALPESGKFAGDVAVTAGDTVGEASAC